MKVRLMKLAGFFLSAVLLSINVSALNVPDYSNFSDDELFDMAMQGVYVNTEEVKTSPALSATADLQKLVMDTEPDTTKVIKAVTIERTYPEATAGEDMGSVTLVVAAAPVWTSSAEMTTSDVVVKMKTGYTYTYNTPGYYYIKTYYGSGTILDSKFWMTKMTIGAGMVGANESHTITNPSSGTQYTYNFNHGTYTVSSTQYMSAGITISYTRNGTTIYTSPDLRA
jgi:hypothetical protein